MFYNDTFGGQKLNWHKYIRDNIYMYDCTVYFSEPVLINNADKCSLIVTIIPHVSGKNPKFYYIVGQWGEVIRATNPSPDINADTSFECWVEVNARRFWYYSSKHKLKGVMKRVMF